jgi:two-component system nitrate/nitrite response regulator NarL
MDKPVTAVVVDDHEFFRDGLRIGLTQSGRVTVVGEAANGRDGLALIRAERPDVAVVDSQMPDVDGIALTQALAREETPTRVLLLSASTASETVFKALEAGARGYLPKEARRSEIIAAVVTIARGGTVIPPELGAGVAEQIRLRAVSDTPILSAREKEVLAGFARGESIPQIAASLFLAPSTVKTHAQRLYEKLGVSDRAAAVAQGMRRGLLD